MPRLENEKERRATTSFRLLARRSFGSAQRTLHLWERKHGRLVLLTGGFTTVFALALLGFYASTTYPYATSERRALTLLRPLTNHRVSIPKSHWPVSMRHRRHHSKHFETTLHPGDGSTQLTVPRFWSPPIHQNSLMSRETAMKVGSCSKADKHGNHGRGEDCPLNQRTILVMISSYRDYECRETVENVFERAEHPHRIRVAVVDQIVSELDVACDTPLKPCDQFPQQALCKHKDHVDVLPMDATLSLGPTFARHLGCRMYRGEFYALQTDAHMKFVQGWDVDIISQFESTGNEMAVLTTYPSSIDFINEDGHSLLKTRPIMCNSEYMEEDEDEQFNRHLEHQIQPEGDPIGVPQLEPWWAAGFSFSRGHFVVNVPYDNLLPMIFMGEEMSMAIRAFTVGYDFYAPDRSVAFHNYNRDESKIGDFAVENAKRYLGLDIVAMKRLLGIIRMNPEVNVQEWDHTQEDIFGIGGVRSPELFAAVFGIDAVNKKNENHLCRWVNAREDSMHDMFSPFLREDKMGIDYSKIDFRFKDPAPDVYDDDGTDNSFVSSGSQENGDIAVDDEAEKEI